MKVKIPNLRLDLIGINSDELNLLPNDIYCHGYLDKGIESEADTYYNLIKNAAIFINTTPKWGAFSASLEAMYFYTPVIVTPYFEFTATFGEIINFGRFYDEKQENLACIIEDILQSEEYIDICENAHNAAKVHTWSSYVDKMLTRIEGII